MKVLGFLLAVAGVLFGVWAGVWWAFIGGIVSVIQEIKAPDTDAINLALGIARIFFAGLIGTMSGTLAVIPGIALMNGSDYNRKPWKRR
jgi:uncharacterized membrane protein